MTRGLYTNLATESEAPSLSPWNSQNVTTTLAFSTSMPTATPAPTALPVKIVDTGTGAHAFFQGLAAFQYGVPVMMSLFVKYLAGTGWCAIGDLNGSTGGYFNVNTGAVGSPINAFTTGMRSYGNGWWRLWVAGIARYNTFACVTTTANNANPSYTATGTEQLALTGMQIEPLLPGQLTPQAYLKTTGGTATAPRDYRQNLVPDSEVLNASSWTIDATLNTVASNGAAPSGFSGSYLISEGSGADSTKVHGITSTTQAVGSTEVVIVARAKPSASNFVALLSGLVGGAGAVFDLSLGTNAAVNGGTPLFNLDIGGGWRLVGAKVPATAFGGSITPTVGLAVSLATVGYFVNAGRSVLVTGVQVAECNVFTEYAQTSGGVWCPSGAPRSLTL